MTGYQIPRAIGEFCKALGLAGRKNLPEEISNILETHAIGAAVAGLGTAWFPGFGAAAAVVANVGFVWSMYIRIGSKIGVPFSRNILKSVATAICTNLASNVVGYVVMASVFSLFPGIGSGAAAMTMAAIGFILTYSCGLIYIKVLTRLAKAHADFNDVSKEDLKVIAGKVIAKEDIKGMMKQAKNKFKAAKARGDIKKGGCKVKPIRASRTSSTKEAARSTRNAKSKAKKRKV